MQKNLLWYRVLIIVITILLFRSASGQQPVDYSYLKKCFSNSPVDSFEIEVKNMGELMSYNIEGDSTLDVLFTYFLVPGDKMNMKLSKIAALAAKRQQDPGRIIQNWSITKRRKQIMPLLSTIACIS